MFFRLHQALSTFALLSFAASGAHAQAVRTAAHPQARITGKANNAVTVSLAGTHPAVVAQSAIGIRVAANAQMTHMRLVLTASDDQLVALHTLMAEQQDKSSANFHKWLTPQTFGQYFGAASSDISALTAWLQDQGFTVDAVSKSNRIITFSGPAAKVEAAFHTQLNNITVNGEKHIANTTDLAIPAAFASVIKGVTSLNDFFPKANNVNPHKGELVTNIPANNYVTANATPLYTSVSSGAHYVAPGDAATIYNSTPLLNAGIDGTGQTVAVLGRSNITLSDVQQFRSMFGLKKNDPTFTVVESDPGVNTDDLEAYLDVEWAGGMAPGANVNFIVGGPDYFNSGGIDAAGLYAVDNNIGDIITLSYGGCETNDGVGGTGFYNTLWEQAAAQGQTVFVSSGDSNATGCQSSSATYGTAYGVNALGSSAYNVAVGGSMFFDPGPGQYWGAGVSAPAPAGYTFSTATSYIPETAWNQGALTTTYLNSLSTALQAGSGIVGTGGGISIYTGRPVWQTGSGISATADSACTSGTCIAAGSPITGLHRLVPDIAFIAASGHDATVFCGEGSCNNTSTGYGIGAIGGTSVATPVMASVQALINQKNGGRQGNANFYYYPLANADYLAGNCKSNNGTLASPTVTLPAATCNFHDIVTGSNASKQNAADTVGLGFNAVAGFDSATGLGSVNIANVANNWATAGLRATTTSITLTPAAGLTHGAAQILSTTVASSTGTPTGDISLIAETTTPGTAFRFTLTAGAYSGSIAGLPGGNYNVHVHYEGDGVYGPSDSASIPVSIAKENSTVTLSVADFYPGAVQTGYTSIPYGYLVEVTAKAAGSSTKGLATGTITYSIAQNGTALAGLTTKLDGYGDANLIAGAGYTSIYLAPNYPALNPGVYVVTASYSGDASFNASTSTATFTIAKVTATSTLTSSAANVTSGASVTLNYTVPRITASYFPTLAAYPTGSVTFVDTTSGTTLGTASLNAAGIATLTSTGITTTGANTITGTYAGDNNYATNTATATVTVGTLTSTSTSLTIASGTYYVGSAVPAVATVTPAASATVRFYDGAILLGSATSSATTGIATLSITNLTAGTHNLSATFAGTTTSAASTGTLSQVINQNITSTVLDAPVISIYGQQISFNGRILRSPTTTTVPLVPLTGTVTFMDGSTPIATATPVFLPGGYAIYLGTASVSLLNAGSHTFTAVYSGDANYTTSTSSMVTTGISKLSPAISISSTGTVYNGAASIPLTATLALPATLTVPSGSVLFYDGSTYLGSATLTYSAAAGGYAANFTATGLASGPHSFTADFGGDGNYLGVISAALPVTITTNNVWIANGNNTVSGLSESGAPITSSAAAGGGTAIAIDYAGDIWSLNKAASSVAEFSKTGAVINAGFTGGGINAPSALAIDGAGTVWIGNGNNTLSGISGQGATVAPNAFVTGFSTPSSVSIDSAGNLWVTNAGDNSVTEVIGIAAPVLTPQSTAVKTSAVAVKP